MISLIQTERADIVMTKTSSGDILLNKGSLLEWLHVMIVVCNLY